MSRVFLISAMMGDYNTANEHIRTILRHLRDTGNDVTFLDMSLLLKRKRSHADIEGIKKELGTTETICSADVVVLITKEYCVDFTQLLQGMFTNTSRNTKRANSIWNHNGVCCTILGNSHKKTKAVKDLWEVFNKQRTLDLTDIFPYGTPYAYSLDYSKETAQPTIG